MSTLIFLLLAGLILSTTNFECLSESAIMAFSEQRTLLLGKMYEARKKSVGNTSSRDSKGKFQLRQNDAIGLGRAGRTSISIAKEMGVGKTTVERAGKFAKGIDALSAVSKEAADKVLSGNSPATKAEISEFPKMTLSANVPIIRSSLFQPLLGHHFDDLLVLGNLPYRPLWSFTTFWQVPNLVTCQYECFTAKAHFGLLRQVT